MGQHGFWAWTDLLPQEPEESSLRPYSAEAFASPAYRSEVPHLFGIRDQLRGRQFFHGLWGWELVLGYFKCITFPVHLISNLMLLPAIRQQLAIWQQVPVHSPWTGDPWFRPQQFVIVWMGMVISVHCPKTNSWVRKKSPSMKKHAAALLPLAVSWWTLSIPTQVTLVL